jgi:Family of unknown function (DUF5330)
MWFLIRVAFWLSIVIMLLPTGQSPVAAQGPQVAAADALSAASAAVTDMRNFCARQPEACAVGSQAATVFGHKAQASAKMIYEYLTEKVGPEGGAASSAGKPAAAAGQMTERSSQNTLTPADRAPAWRGPPPRQELARRPA